MRRIWSLTRGLRRCDAERRLWRQLRDLRLAGLRFRRKHPVAGYIADFACVERGLVVELTGDRPGPVREYDRRRSEIIAAAGYRIVRVASEDVLRRAGEVAAGILRHAATDGSGDAGQVRRDEVA